MRKITLLLLFVLSTITFQAQTVAWSSDSEDYNTANWTGADLDTDGNNWGAYSGFETTGFTGLVWASQSWNGTDGALTPDNVLFTPTFSIPGIAISISFKMKVAASYNPDFAEHYAVYVYDDAEGASFDDNIFEETLTAGGDGTAKDITATIPVSFAGKTIGILIRHYNCTNQEYLVVDDFEVSYNTTLSAKTNQLDIAGVFPNPVKDVVKIKTNEVIDVITIVNQLGQHVMEFKGERIINHTINLSALTKGFYFMIVNAKNKSQTVKIIKD